MKINKTITILGIVMMVTVIVTSALLLNQKQLSAEKILGRLALTDQDLVDIVMNLDERLDEPADIGARITGEALLFNQGEEVFKMLLPNDLFFVSIAPYINEVHPCQIHNLISCRGEMYGETMLITIRLDDGSMIFSEERTTQANGFIGLWLPRGIEGTLTVEMINRIVSHPIATFENSDTCITTPLKLLPKS